MRHRILETPTGQFVLIESDGQIRTTWMNAEVRRMLASSRYDVKLLPNLANRLVRYFKGQSIDFSDVAAPGGGAFYVKCWKACRRIPRGQTRSYAELAVLAGSTASAARAAGQAMRNNPLPIIIPCHRVIATGGNLHGFSGSCDANGRELAVKSALLEMEGALVNQNPRLHRTSASRRPRLIALH